MRIKLIRIGGALIMPLVLFVLLILLTPQPVAAATVTWDGPNNTDWGTPSNWDGDVLPTANDDVIIPAGAVNIFVNIDVTIQSLSVQGGNIFLLGGYSLTATNGIILTNTAKIRINEGATLTGDTYVNEFSTLEIRGGNTGILNGNLTLAGTLATGHGGSNAGFLEFTGAVFTNNNGTYEDNNGTITFNGSSAQSIGGSSATTFRNLTINNSNGVNLNTDVTVNNVLALSSGDLTTGANRLIMASGATSSGDGDVVGTVRRTSFTTGTNYSFGNPDVMINFASATTLPSQVEVNLVKSAPGTGTNAVQRTYNISQSGGNGFAATLRLAYQDSELNGNTESTLTLWRNNAGTWQDLGKSGNDTTANYVEQNNITEFSEWALSSAAPTAVDLASFSVTNEGSHLQLGWATVWESNNLGFNLYRSTSAEFSGAELVNEELITAEGPGSGQGSTYQYEDHDVLLGTTYYYWLEDIDVGGHKTQHGPISIDYENIPTSVKISRLESNRPSKLSWLVMLTVLGMTIGVLPMAYCVWRRFPATDYP